MVMLMAGAAPLYGFRRPVQWHTGATGAVHPILSRRGETLQVPQPRSGTEPMHLLVDSTGLKLGGPGEWLVERHGTSKRRSWRKLHLGVDAATGQIAAVELTGNETDDGSQVGPLLDQVDGSGRFVHRRRRL